MRERDTLSEMLLHVEAEIGWEIKVLDNSVVVHEQLVVQELDVLVLFL